MINKIRHKYKEKATLFNMALSYMLIGSFFISIFAVVLVYRVTDEITSEVRENSEKMVYQSYTTANIVLSNAYRQFYNVFNKDEWISEALYGSDLDRTEIGKIGMRLGELIETNPLVHSIYVYNYQDRIVISNLSTVRTIEQFYDEEMTEIIKNGAIADKQGYFIPRSVNFEILGRSYNSNIISLIFSDTGPDSFSHGVLAVNFNQRLFQQLLTQGGFDSSSNIMIVNAQGTVISHPDREWINRNVSGERYIRNVIDAKAKKGNQMGFVNGSKAMITYVKSDSLGWIFIVVSDYQQLIGRAELLKRFILTITAVFALLALIAGGVFTNRFYKPVRRLLLKAGTASAEALGDKALSEYERIYRSFDTMESRIARLQSDLKQHMPESKKAYLVSLINGERKPSIVDPDKPGKLGLRIREGKLVVCVIRLDQYSRLVEQFGTNDLSLLKYAITNIAEEVASSRFSPEIVEDAEDNVSMIFNIADQSQVKMGEAISMAVEIQGHIRKFLNLSVTIGIGVVAERFDQIRHAWNSASQAANYRFIYGKGKVLVYSQINHIGFKAYDYPIQLENKIMDCLKSGDLRKLGDSFDEFAAYIREMNIDEIRLSLTQLMVMTLRTSIEMVDDPEEEWMMELQDAHSRFRWHDTMEEIREWYIGLCGRIMNIRDTKAANKSSALIECMAAFIHERYSDPNLSIAELADEIGLSTNYARKIFKDRFGLSISNYINDIRFKKARELLIETDLPASKIGEMIGMTNPSYFYVAFKKHAGKTPDHFRRDYGMKQLAE
ncbi:helix-turn-helix domain-containing protein [Paenibacillus alkalitolerans]|uniref:helix-turn-helix domain-containing protein n=1 Tax=Paenibacillus alkalitolerans TaxID=2799335 RepID=UPI0018F63DD6|nr:helix-turn-helix domain-containing protein [Paenibacillus alkalitolerans]